MEGHVAVLSGCPIPHIIGGGGGREVEGLPKHKLCG